MTVIRCLGKMDLQPAHTKAWYQTKVLLCHSLIAQSVIAMLACIPTSKLRSLIPDITTPLLIDSNAVLTLLLLNSDPKIRKPT